jgi:hypothetical protein
VLALALYSQAAYEEVLRCLVEGLGWAVRARRGRRSWPYWHVPGASALGEARTRLGAEPLKALFAQAARPLAPSCLLTRCFRTGPWLSRLYAASDRRKRHPIIVRVIEYTLSDPGRRTSVDRYQAGAALPLPRPGTSCRSP